jgi:uncharacterized protein
MLLRALGLALTLFLAIPATADSLPEPLSDTVSDFAGLLDATEEGRIGRLLHGLRDQTGVHVVVAIMEHIADHGGAGMRLDTYAKALLNAWGIGDPQRNDGILLLVVTGPREARIALGAGFDAVYDGRAARVLSTAVLPEFREGRISDGIEAGVVSIRERLVVPFLEGRPVSVNEGFREQVVERDLPWLLGLGGVGGVVALVFWRMRARRRCPNCGHDTLERLNEVIEAPSALSPGTGLLHMTCGLCGFNDRKTFVIPRSGRMSLKSGGRTGSTGRSGGFGGGRSSGGGASGKW